MLLVLAIGATAQSDAPPDNPWILLRNTNDRHERCLIMKRTYGVVPGKSFGTLSPQGIAYWGQFSCDQELAEPDGASPPPLSAPEAAAKKLEAEHASTLQPSLAPPDSVMVGERASVNATQSTQMGALLAENATLHTRLATLEVDHRDLRSKVAALEADKIELKLQMEHVLKAIASIEPAPLVLRERRPAVTADGARADSGDESSVAPKSGPS